MVVAFDRIGLLASARGRIPMRSDKARLALGLYGLVAGVAVLLGLARGEPDVYHHPAPLLRLPLWVELPLGLVVGAAVGLAVVWLTQRAVVRWRWRPAVRVHRGLRELLGVRDERLAEGDVLVLAASSAVAEEMLFRGWLLPIVGLLLSSLIFGALHVAPRRREMWPWIPMAVAMGLVLGGLFALLGGLAAPVVAHFVVNYRNLHFVNDLDPDIVSTGRVEGGRGEGAEVLDSR